MRNTTSSVIVPPDASLIPPNITCSSPTGALPSHRIVSVQIGAECTFIGSDCSTSQSSAVNFSLIQHSILEVDFLPMVMAAKFQITFFFLSQVMTRGLLLHVSVEIVLHCCIILAVSDNQITCLKTKLTSHGPRLLGVLVCFRFSFKRRKKMQVRSSN